MIKVYWCSALYLFDTVVHTEHWSKQNLPIVSGCTVCLCVCAFKGCEVFASICEMSLQKKEERDRQTLRHIVFASVRERACVVSSLKMADLVKQRIIMDIIIAHTNYLK